QRPPPREAQGAPVRAAVAAVPVAAAPAQPKRKLSYKEQRELESLPGDLEKLEAEQQELHGRIAAPDYHRAGADQMRSDSERVAELEKLISNGMDRWQELDALASKIGAGRT
ncbi:MAG TPA: hypothetical protein VM146_02505, partial [Steroidobacteraceae bacterium]|nr:hypothetical protein [Steroidobacteraceae bacterium]